MVLSLRGDSQSSSVSTGSVGHTFSPPGATGRNATTRSGFNIPLTRFENGYGTETFGGVKVQVSRPVTS